MLDNAALRFLVPLTFGCTVTVSSVLADPPAQEVRAPHGPAGDHCVVELAPAAKDAKASVASEIGCYGSFSNAIEAATNGEVTLPQWASPDSISESDIASEAVAIIGIDYDGFNYRGASLTWTTRNLSGCFRGSVYRANQPASFNNRLSSTRGFSGCNKNTSYDGYFQTGSFVRCFPNCSLRGFFMNNRTSSKRWSR